MIQITWLTQGGFLFCCGNTRLVIDPYMSDFLEKNHNLTRLCPFPLALDELRPDWLACTHDHLDHLDPQTVADVARAYPQCNFIGPASCHAHFLKLGISSERCHSVDMGKAYRCGDFTLSAVPAFHSDPFAVGFVIAADGRRIYLSGDSNYSPELVNEHTKGCDCVIICINGKLNNMNAEDAARVVAALRPRLAIPMHYGLFAENTVAPDDFVARCAANNIDTFVMTPGEEFSV